MHETSSTDGIKWDELATSDDIVAAADTWCTVTYICTGNQIPGRPSMGASAVAALAVSVEPMPARDGASVPAAPSVRRLDRKSVV